MAKAKAVEQLEQVTIRFAGDSGDGMQLTGDRFTSETAVLGNDLSTLPDFPAEIRAPAGSLPGVSGFQLHFADHDILTPGDAPNVLVAMNPAALKTNLGDLPKGGTLIVDTDQFKERNLQKAGYAANPLEDGSLEDYHVHPVGLTSMTVEGLKGIAGITPREAERSKNFFALGLMSWLYNRPTDGTLGVHRAEVRQAARDRAGERDGVQGRLRLRRDLRGLRRQLRDRACADASWHLPPDLGEHGARLRADRGLEALRARPLPRRVPDHARLLDPGGARAAQGVRRADVPGRGRDRGGRRGARSGLRRLARRLHLGRPGDRAEAGDDRARDHARAAAPDPRHPARGPLDRDADEAGAGRPPDGALRPERREPGAGARGVDAVAVLPRGDRGGADRAQVPDAGLSALRCVPGERVGAVAASGRGEPAGHLDDVRDRRRRASSRTRAIRRRSRGRGRSPARPGSSTGSAGSRRPT